MAHLDNFAKSTMYNIIKEQKRELEKYKNDVDHTRSWLNYTYGSGDVSSALDIKNKITQRVDEIMEGRKLQKQTNIMSSWCVTFPFDYCTECDCILWKNGKQVPAKYNRPNDPKQAERFFEEVYKFTEERYGKDNVICGNVHMDEKTPHIHIAFVPETISRKTGKRTVSSASLITRVELRSFQQDLDRHIEETLGMKGAILNGRTKGNYTVEELKERSERELDLNDWEHQLNLKGRKLDKWEKNLKERENEVTERENNVFYREVDVNIAMEQVEELNEELQRQREEFENEKKERNEELQRQREEFENEKKQWKEETKQKRDKSIDLTLKYGEQIEKEKNKEEFAERTKDKSYMDKLRMRMLATAAQAEINS